MMCIVGKQVESGVKKKPKKNQETAAAAACLSAADIPFPSSCCFPA